VVNPLFALTIASFLLFILFLFFQPDKGVFWKWQRGLMSTKRILIEDALKHLYDQEYKELISTLKSLAGALSITGDEAAELIKRLQGLRLVRIEKESLFLTTDGQKEALRMIRIHRLWERYLADETGISETEWHKRAEILEHNTSEKDMDKLIASVGHSPYDPHGDPIPTAAGKMPPQKGLPLNDLEIDEVARIIHVEDEPSAVYAQLVAEGLHPGMLVRITDKNVHRVQFISEGEEIKLAPVVAANLTVERLKREQAIEENYKPLTSLAQGESGKVLAISSVCRGQQRQRLMDLGIIPGTIISMEMSSASGDPVAFNIRGATIALRKEQANLIHIESVEEVAQNVK